MDGKGLGNTFDIEKLIDRYGTEITNSEIYGINNRFVEEKEYSGIIQKARDSSQRQNVRSGGQNLNDVYKLAYTRIERKGGNRTTLPQSKKRTLTRSVFDYLAKNRTQFGLPFPTVFNEGKKYSFARAKAI